MFGARLDRPSAIGDEGRPRATSLGIAALTVVLLAGATGYVLGDVQLLGGYALFAGLTVAGMALLGRDRFGPKVVGHLLYLPCATGLTGLLLLRVATPGSGLLYVGFAAAFLGTAASWADVGDGDAMESSLGQSVLSYTFTYVVFIALAVVGGAAAFGWALLDGLVGTSGSTFSVTGFLAVLTITVACVRFALGTLPIVQLTPVDRRDEIRDRVGRLRHQLLLAAVGAGLLAIVALIVLDAVLAVGSAPAVAFRALGVFSSVFVVGPVAALGALGLGAGLLAIAVRKSTTRLGSSAMRQAAAAVAAVLYVVLLAFLVPTLVAALGLLGPFVLALAAIATPIGIFVLHGFALLLVRTGVFPDRAGGPALTGAGLVVAAVGAATSGLPAALVFACAVGALIAWDVGSFGLGLTAELGHLPETRRLELFHGVFAVGVGVLALAGALLVETLRTSVGTEIGAAPAMTIAAVGVLLVLAPLRG